MARMIKRRRIGRNRDETIEVEEALPEPSIELVREETSRRLREMFGARDNDHLAIMVQDATISAVTLIDGRSARSLTKKERDRQTDLRAKVQTYLAIKAIGNSFEAMDPIPADFADDANWAV